MMKSSFDPLSLPLHEQLEFIRRAEIVLALIIQRRIEQAQQGNGIAVTSAQPLPNQVGSFAAN